MNARSKIISNIISDLIRNHKTGKSMLQLLIKEAQFSISNLVIIRRSFEYDEDLPVLDKCIENYSYVLAYFQDLDEQLTLKESEK